jgi:hypothetical protein
MISMFDCNLTFSLGSKCKPEISRLNNSENFVKRGWNSGYNNKEKSELVDKIS